MPKISVIMPVYNSEQFLRMAVDSVLNQTFEDFELILVDDGSKDQSGAICDEYAQKDARVKVIHQENGGICAARNTGMKAAEGEYLAFIDNDDEYLPNLLEDNYALAKEYNADVVKYGSITRAVFADGTEKDINRCVDKLEFISQESLKNYFIPLKRNLVLNVIWNGLYRTDIIKKNNIQFNPYFKTGCDDQIFNIDVYDKITSMVVTPKNYHIWYCRDVHSTSRKFQENKAREHYEMFQYEMNFLVKMNVWDEQYFAHKSMEILSSFIAFNHHKNTTLTGKQQIEAFKWLRQQPYFDQEWLAVKKNRIYLSKKAKIYFTLFYKKFFWLLELIVKLYMPIIAIKEKSK